MKKCLVYNVQEVSKFFRSVANIISISDSTKLSWKKDNSFWVALGEPGTAEVNTNWRQVNLKTNELHAHYTKVFYKKLIRSPKEAEKYKDQMKQLRNIKKDHLNKTFSDAIRINREVNEMMRFRIRYLATIEATCTTTVTALSVATGNNVVPLLYALGLELAHKHNQTDDEVAVALIKTTTTDVATGKLTNFVKVAGQSATVEANMLQKVAVENYKWALNQTKPVQDAAISQLNSAANNKTYANLIGSAGRGLTFVFAANTIVESWKHQQKIWEAAE